MRHEIVSDPDGHFVIVGAAGALMSAYVCLQPFIKRWLGPGDVSYFPLVYVAVHSIWCLVVFFTSIGDVSSNVSTFNVALVLTALSSNTTRLAMYVPLRGLVEQLAVSYFIS